MLFLLLLSFGQLFAVPSLRDGRIRPDNGALHEENLLPLKSDPTLFVPLTYLLQHEKNFTAYSDTLYHEIKESYTTNNEKRLREKLWEGYLTLGDSFPSRFKLNIEKFYLKTPLLWIVIALYLLALIPRIQLPFFLLAFTLHTLILLMRSYILMRPPVSNMYETVLYVPWVASLAALLMYRQKTVITAAALFAPLLLIALKLSGLQETLGNLQPVLNSQFWLLIHVLLVVGSYGLFGLSSLLSHFYLFIRKPPHTLIANLFYLGTAALIAGTLLGGVWASQSWGRFWDWDPKESWAFISASVALIAIHAYRFGHIGPLGLARASILAFCFISFTWYGVNFILGTGLHSYGFGSSGLLGYLFFLLFETAFLLSTSLKPKSKQKT